MKKRSLSPLKLDEIKVKSNVLTAFSKESEKVENYAKKATEEL